MGLEISMLTALVIIVIILASGVSRRYIKRKFDIADELKMIDKANARHTIAKQGLQNAHH